MIKEQQIKQAEYQMWEFIKSMEKVENNTPRYMQRFRDQAEFVLGCYPLVERKELLEMCYYL